MTNYLIKKEYGIETGLVFHHGGTDYLVVDLITHVWNHSKKLHEALPDPYVVYRALAMNNNFHERMIMPLAEFKQKLT